MTDREQRFASPSARRARAGDDCGHAVGLLLVRAVCHDCRGAGAPAMTDSESSLHTKDIPTPGCACWGCFPHKPSYFKGPSPFRSDGLTDYDQGKIDGISAERDRQQRLREEGIVDEL